MKLRYYLRGAGTGIIVTAVLLGIILGHGKSQMSDGQIKIRAAELGMVEEKLLSDMGNETSELVSSKEASNDEVSVEKVSENKASEGDVNTSDTNSDDTNTDDVNTDDVNTDNVIQESKKNTEDDSLEVTKEETGLVETHAEEVGLAAPDDIKIEISSGDSSVVVSKKLEQAGLVSSAVEYDQYLCANGYDKKLSVGVHLIPQNAEYESIALLLTTRQ